MQVGIAPENPGRVGGFGLGGVGDIPGFSGHVTISLGVGTRTTDFDSIDTLLKVSDEAVYASKRKGRNSVSVGKIPPANRESA